MQRNLGKIVRKIGNDVATVHRSAVTTIDGNGRASAQTDASTIAGVQGSLQPLPGKDLMRLPEGERRTERRVFYTTTALNVTNDVAGVLADWLSFGVSGETWEVESDQNWQSAGLYQRYILRKREV